MALLCGCCCNPGRTCRSRCLEPPAPPLQCLDYISATYIVVFPSFLRVEVVTSEFGYTQTIHIPVWKLGGMTVGRGGVTVKTGLQHNRSLTITQLPLFPHFTYHAMNTVTWELLSTNQEVYQLKVCIDGICRDGTLHTCTPKGPLWIKRSVFSLLSSRL